MEESNEDNMKNLCQACLSQDRKLRSFELLRSKFLKYYNIDFGLPENAMVCGWCHVELTTMLAFKDRVEIAQKILLESGDISELKPLSTLKIVSLPSISITDFDEISGSALPKLKIISLPSISIIPEDISDCIEVIDESKGHNDINTDMGHYIDTNRISDETKLEAEIKIEDDIYNETVFAEELDILKKNVTEEKSFNLPVVDNDFDDNDFDDNEQDNFDGYEQDDLDGFRQDDTEQPDYDEDESIILRRPSRKTSKPDNKRKNKSKEITKKIKRGKNSTNDASIAVKRSKKSEVKEDVNQTNEMVQLTMKRTIQSLPDGVLTGLKNKTKDYVIHVKHQIDNPDDDDDDVKPTECVKADVIKLDVKVENDDGKIGVPVLDGENTQSVPGDTDVGAVQSTSDSTQSTNKRRKVYPPRATPVVLRAETKLHLERGRAAAEEAARLYWEQNKKKSDSEPSSDDESDSSSNASDFTKEEKSVNKFKSPLEKRKPHRNLTLGDTLRMQNRDVYTINKVTHEEFIELLAKRKESQRFTNCKLKCERCVLTFTSHGKFKQHIRAHMRKGHYKCDICNIAWRKKSLEKHRERHYWFYKCCTCDFGSLNLEFMMVHYDAHHAVTIRKCYECNVEFTTAYDYKLHCRAQHRLKPVCPHCGKKLFSKASMDRHILRHTEEKPVDCPVCQRTYKSERQLRLHMHRIHERDPSKKDEAAYCAECDKHFLSPMTYRLHIKNSRVHNNAGKDFPHVCSLCDKRFAMKRQLETHFLTMHSDTRDCHCPQCPQSFKTTKQLAIHKKKVHEGYKEPKNKVCDFCAKAFTNSRLLQDHRHSHTGERPYSCEHCGQTFAYRSALYTHKKVRHKRTDAVASVDALGSADAAGFYDAK